LDQRRNDNALVLVGDLPYLLGVLSKPSPRRLIKEKVAEFAFNSLPFLYSSKPPTVSNSDDSDFHNGVDPLRRSPRVKLWDGLHLPSSVIKPINNGVNHWSVSGAIDGLDIGREHTSDQIVSRHVDHHFPLDLCS
jgi:hypothetical protein